MFMTCALDQLHESPWNPRKHWNDAALDELTDSVRQVGVLTPLLVRPRGTAPADGYEIAAGHRRFRAAQRAGLTVVPALVRELDDRTFLEILTIENLQREDIHPVDEAEGYAQLMATDRAYTIEAIAARVGKSVSYVRQRLALRKLTDAAREHYLKDEITAAHAVRLAHLTPAQQAQALEEVVFFDLLDDKDSAERGDAVAQVWDLDEWIMQHVRLDLEAPETLEQFPEIAAAAAVDGATILQLTDSWDREDGGPLGRMHFREIAEKKDRCLAARQGVFVQGYRRGKVITVCATQGCPKHWPKTSATRGTSSSVGAANNHYEKQQAKWERDRKLFEIVRPKVVDAIVTATRGIELTLPFVIDMITEGSTGTVKVAELMGLKAIADLPPAQYAQAIHLSIALASFYTLDQATRIAKEYQIDTAALIRLADAELTLAEKAAATASKAKPSKTRSRKQVA